MTSQTILRYISFLFEYGYASSSIESAISSLVYFNKLNGFFDPRDELVKKALVGVKNLRPRGQGSLPIPIEMLHKLIAEASVALKNEFTAILFKAMISLAYFALLRVGEFTYSQHCLLKENITIFQYSISIQFQSFKHSHGQGITQVIPVRSQDQACPVYLLKEYLPFRPKHANFLFAKLDGRAPSRAEFQGWMFAVMEYCGYELEGYNTHSLRVGMATHMALQGHSSEQIKLAGRWGSDAYKKYIRVNRL